MTETCHDDNEVPAYSSPLSSSVTSTATCPRPMLTEDTKVNIQIGERRFTTTRDTLVGGSDYFAARFSGNWNDAEPDGSYFVDGDPDLFVHILRFLRSGTFPLFYDKHRGHDYSLYAALLAQAQYFQIPPLVDWLRERKYLGRVMTDRKASLVDDVRDLALASESGEDVDI
ncbi:hypothetical protein SLS58_002940 [Diplodia intermedia]|uniref:BTB domain-containing protein n=1 Tax=Diplodia intermedia TaxID=856260 RepID=A0ABR3TY26_9PEZI